MMRITQNNIQGLKENEIFVFGSNNEGLHYGGAAKLAHEKFGAIMGQGFGLQGQSFAIDTMTGLYRTKIHINEFIKIVNQNEDKVFYVTEIGCGIAGFTVEEIAPLFKECLELENVYLPERFINHLKQL